MNKTQNAVIIWEYENPKYTDRQVLNRLLKIASAERQIAALQAEVKALRADLIGDAKEIRIDTDRFKLTYQAVKSMRVDTKKLKADGLYDDYAVESTAMRFNYDIK